MKHAISYGLLLVLFSAGICVAQSTSSPTELQNTPTLPIGCATADNTCVPLRTGEQPFDLAFSLPYAFSDADCGGASGHSMPGTSYTYPGTGTTRHVWCPQTMTQIQAIMAAMVAGTTIGGVVPTHGDIIALDTETVNPSGYRATAQISNCNPNTAPHFQSPSYLSSCDLRFPGLTNTTHEITYLISRGYASLPTPGNRVGIGDHPNEALLKGTNLNLQFELPAYTNNWRMVGLEVLNDNIGGFANSWQRGFTYAMIVAEGAGWYSGKRELSATTGGTVEYLGRALEVSTSGAGVILSITPNQLAPSSTGTVTIITQDSHACDNVTVTCASVGSDLPTAATFGYGVTVNSIAVGSTSCPSGVSGTCQSIALSLTTSADVLPPYSFSPKSLPSGNLALRTPLLRTVRRNAGYVDEYLYSTNGFQIYSSSLPRITQVINATYGGNIVATPASGSVTQTLRILGANTTFTSAPGGIPASSILLGVGATSPSSATVISDTEIDVVVSQIPTYHEIGPDMTVVLPGASGSVQPVLDYNPASTLVIPSTNTASWISSMSCLQVVPGETYTCDVYGVNTNWTSGTTLAFTTKTMPNGSPDISAPTKSIISPTHAQITFTLDATASAGVDHITWDRCEVHGVDPIPVLNANTAIYEPQVGGSAEGSATLYQDQGSYMAIIDSFFHSSNNFQTGINEGHILTNLSGPGPRYIRNNEFKNSAIMNFIGGSGYNGQMMSPNVQVSDLVYIQNNYHMDVNLMGLSYPQYLQPAQNAGTPITNLTITTSGGQVTGVTGTQPTGFVLCPTSININAVGAGSGAVLTCSVVAGQLHFVVSNPGSGYTTPPNLSMNYFFYAVKNHLEHKNGSRILASGNYFGLSWAESFQSQLGNGILMSPKSGSQGILLNTVRDYTVINNWFDMQFVAISIYSGTDDCWSNGTKPLLAYPEVCAPPWLPAGQYPVPLTNTAGYVLGHAGATLSNIAVTNNLMTGHTLADVAPYVNRNTSLGEYAFPNYESVISDNEVYNAVYNHNTMWRHPGVTNNRYGYNSAAPHGLCPNAYLSSTPFSNYYNRFTTDNVIWCQPTGQCGPQGWAYVQTQMACPTAPGGGESCQATGGTNYESRFKGNLLYNGAGCANPGTVDWTNGGKVSPEFDHSTTTVPTFANASAYTTAVAPGDWTLVSPKPPVTSDSTNAGVNMATLLSALGNAITGQQGSSGVSISTTTVATGAVGETYSSALSATGGTPPYSSWTATGLPAGLSLNSSTGVITGTPTARTSGVATFNVTVQDSLAASSSSTPIQITINSRLAITSASLPTGTVGTAYSTTLQQTGGLGSFTWSLVSGSLPAGLSLSSLRGAITGTPTTVYTYTFNVQVKDVGITDCTGANSPACSVFSIVIAAPMVYVSPISIPTMMQNAAITAIPVVTSGGTNPNTCTLLPGSAWPTGVTMSSCSISGTPTVTGNFSVNIQVTDSASHTVQSGTLNFSVQPAVDPLAITTTSVANGIVSVPYSAALAATGGVQPYTWAVASGSLPPGLSITGTLIAGLPTTIGIYTFTVQVIDSQSSVANSPLLSIIIQPLAGSQVGTKVQIGPKTQVH